MDTDGKQFLDAPIFRPTEEQFNNGPVNYIQSIAKDDSSLACCIIVPPQSFNPCFSLGQDKFRFKTIRQDFLAKDDFQDEKDFTFRQYSEMGDDFKSDYFGKPPNMVPVEEIEENFWSLVTQGEDVHIFSAQCLSTKDHGSGFPCKKSSHLLTGDDKYFDHPWNLNNILESNDNMLNFMNPQQRQNINPTMDVGMCFSHRGWRRDLHWTYSLHYLHCGDSKVWFAVSPQDNPSFESNVISGCSPLPINHQDFTDSTESKNDGESSPRMKKTKMIRVEQQPGQFLVIFPSVYFMTFDTGVNVTESVIFAPVDWLPIGSQAVQYLCNNNLSPLFSHEELISRLASDSEFLDINVVKIALKSFESAVLDETNRRKVIDEFPFYVRQRQVFELVAENDRRCIRCNFIVFFSAVTCTCNTGRFVCLRHVDKLCDQCQTSNKIFRYRYNKSEFEELTNGLRERIESFELWEKAVEEALHNDGKKVSEATLRSLLRDAEDKGFPRTCKAFAELCSCLQEFKQIMRVVKDLLDQQARYTEEENHKKAKIESCLAQSSPRIKKKMDIEKEEAANQGGFQVKSKAIIPKSCDFGSENRKLSLTEFSSFCDELETYPFLIPGMDRLQNLLFRCKEIYKEVDDVLSGNQKDQLNSNKLENIIHDANSLSFICFDRKLEALKDKLEEVRWIEDCSPVFDHDDSLEGEPHYDLSGLKNLIEEGIGLKSPSTDINSYLNRLNKIYEDASEWLEKAKDALNAVKQRDAPWELEEKPSIESIEKLVAQAQENPGLRAIDLSPYLQHLGDLLTKCQRWLKKVDSVMMSLRVEGVTKEEKEDEIPFVTQLEDLYNQGRSIGCHFDILSTMKAALENVNSWRERLNKTFLRKNSLYQIINILAPRSNHSLPSSIDVMNFSSRSIYQQMRKFCSQNLCREGNRKLTGFEKKLGGDLSSERINQIYLQAESEEEAEILLIREKNITKNNEIASNEFGPGDDDTGSNAEKEGKNLKERDKHLKKFCYCGKPVGEWMAQCQLCQEWYHLNCVQSYLPMVNFASKGRKQSSPPNSEEIRDQFNFLCVLCHRGKRPFLDYVQDLTYSYSKLPVRVLEGELLLCLSRRIEKYREKVKKEISYRPELEKAYEMAERNCLSSSEPSSQETSITDSPSKSKRKSPLIPRGELGDEPSLVLSEESRTVLWDLICEGNLLEATIPELQTLWATWLLANPSWKTLVYINPSLVSLTPLASQASSIGTSKRSLEYSGNPEGDSKDLDPSRSKMKRKRRDRGVFERSIKRKGRKAKNDKESVVSIGPELCSLDDECLRPEGIEVDWIFCDGLCQGWFHQLCAGFSSPQEAAHLEKYYCDSCRMGEKNSEAGRETKETSTTKADKEEEEEEEEEEEKYSESGDVSPSHAIEEAQHDEVMEQDENIIPEEGMDSPTTKPEDGADFSNPPTEKDPIDPQPTEDQNDSIEDIEAMGAVADDSGEMKDCEGQNDPVPEIIFKDPEVDDEETSSCLSDEQISDDVNISIGSIRGNIGKNLVIVDNAIQSSQIVRVNTEEMGSHIGTNEEIIRQPQVPDEEMISSPSPGESKIMVEPIENVIEPIENDSIEPIESVTVEPIEGIVVDPIEPVVDEPIESVSDEPIEPVVDEPIETVVDEPIETVITEAIEELGEPIEEIVDEPVETVVGETIEMIVTEPANQTPDEQLQASDLGKPSISLEQSHS